MSAYTLPAPASGSVQNNGVLAKWIKQTVDNTPCEMSNGEINYKEKWKGPYTSGKTILGSIKVGDTLSQAHSGMGTKVEEFSAPSCPTRNSRQGTWKVKEVRVEQIAAGDHCYLHLTFWADYASTDVQTLTEVEEMNVWSISWQAYSVSPWDFCANGGSPSPWSPTYEDEPPQPNWAKLASRANIEAAMNQSPEFVGEFIVYTPDKNVPDYKMYLDAANTAIQKKVGLDRNATYHYPIISHQTVHEGGFNASYTGQGTLGEDIDRVTSLPQGCPYTFPASGEEAWSWIKIADDMQQQRNETSNKTTFTRHEKFMGIPANAVDLNYYGTGAFSHTEQGITNGRWKRNSI